MCVLPASVLLVSPITPFLLRRKKKSPDPTSEPGDAVFHPRFLSYCPYPRGKALQTMTSRSSGFRIILLAAPSHPLGQWNLSAFVPGYGGGSATAFHRLPFFVAMSHPSLCFFNSKESWCQALFRHFGGPFREFRHKVGEIPNPQNKT